ncbi:MAG: endopeptidase La [Epulopiscium sp.]|jgi:ATP-dependent Lon protease|nr:endopeptidase La [Candidatus Epulonipiscium sp.]
MMERKFGEILPLIPLRELTVFPHMVISFPVGRQKSLKAVELALEEERYVFLITQKEASVSSPKREELFNIGTIAKIKQVLKLPGDINHIIVEGVKRGKLMEMIEEDDCDYGDIMPIEQDFEEEAETAVVAMMKVAQEYYEKYAKVSSQTSVGEILVHVMTAEKPGQMSDLIASGLEMKPEQKQELLELVHPIERLNAVIEFMSREVEILQYKKEIEAKVKKRIDKAQREYFLREELKVIQEELGDKDSITSDADHFRELMKKKNLPKEVEETLEKEIRRMLRIPVTSPESNVSRSYIETILQLPWSEKSKAKLDLKRAEDILNEDHYGMEKVKERILEYLAVRKNAPNQNTPILCLVGPPGVGKTSIVRSVAKALNRNYVRMSLGGIKDEAEIRGHRKTYIGAMPGRIINAMRQAKTINPLILLDEVDKLGVSHNGDPAAALLEVLDGEQNNAFRDHYVELSYDLSKVFFVCTANSLATISQPLKDRMEIVEVPSYTSEEKKQIALRHLLVKQMKKHGLKENQLQLEEAALDMVIDGYTKEAGVRQLERVIGQLCRKAVRKIFDGEPEGLVVTTGNVEKLLGTRKYRKSSIYDEPQVGIARGLAWTQFGGETLSIEVNTMKGSGKFELTGNMGNVMKESAKAAISYIRSQSEKLRLDENFYKEQDIHIHIPEGAVPKDGPSAGITMATAMISALTGAKICNDVAMTGEITIRGKVLPIGGLKEKVLAAKKAGIVKVILPEDNQRDLEDIPEEVKDGLTFVLARTMEDVLEQAAAEGENIWK